MFAHEQDFVAATLLQITSEAFENRLSWILTKSDWLPPVRIRLRGTPPLHSSCYWHGTHIIHANRFCKPPTLPLLIETGTEAFHYHFPETICFDAMPVCHESAAPQVVFGANGRQWEGTTIKQQTDNAASMHSFVLCLWIIGERWSWKVSRNPKQSQFNCPYPPATINQEPKMCPGEWMHSI